MRNAYLESSQGKALAVLLLVFLGGAASGALGIRAYQHFAPPEDTAVSPAPSPKLSELAVEHLREELELDSTQMSRVQSILDQCIMKQADMYVELRNLQSEGREQILAILNEKQRKKFETLIDQASAE